MGGRVSPLPPHNLSTAYRHNQTYMTNSLRHTNFGIEIRLLFLFSTARATGMNMSVKRQEIAN